MYVDRKIHFSNLHVTGILQKEITLTRIWILYDKHYKLNLKPLLPIFNDFKIVNSEKN